MATIHSAAKVSRPGEDCNAVWQKESCDLRKELNVPASTKPWTQRPGFRGLGLPKTPRVLEALDLCVIMKCKELRCELTGDLASLMRNQFIDVSQSISRSCFTNRYGVNHALTTSSVVYSFERDSVLTGKELLLLHGQPKRLSVPSELSESTISQAAGEGFACPCIAAILWSVYLTKRFPEAPMQ